VALNGRGVLFSSDTEGGGAVRGDTGGFSLVFVGVEERDDDDEKDLVGRGAGVVGRRPKGAKTVPQEAESGHMSAHGCGRGSGRGAKTVPQEADSGRGRGSGRDRGNPPLP
jgi:hypothetical protein